jgi:hypothetical protein
MARKVTTIVAAHRERQEGWYQTHRSITVGEYRSNRAFFAVADTAGTPSHHYENRHVVVTERRPGLPSRPMKSNFQKRSGGNVVGNGLRIT